MNSIVLKQNKYKLGIINTDNKIFKLIKPDENTLLSNMSQTMLEIFLELLKNYNLEYRNTLNFKKTTTFGYEIEFEDADIDIIKEYLNRKNKEWFLLFDPSLKKGAEIPTPILKDNEKTWKETKKLCTFLKQHSAIKENCGGHIHIGKQVLGNSNKSLLNFLKLWSTYEHIIYRFSYGEDKKPRHAIKEYAKPISNDFWQTYNEYKDNLLVPKEEIIKKVTVTRNRGVSLKYLLFYERPEIDTVEFRCPNGTLNPIIWQNNTNLFVKLLEYSKNPNFDNNTIQLRHKKREEIYSNLEKYNIIYLKDALELSDLIFKNNIDKIYFLKQYIK
ncbi:MAG: amidoligase family protein [Bacilli bacterium]|nr:amidoligase family protein [Bacilli bacterium]